MEGGIGFMVDNKKAKSINSYAAQEIVDSHDRQRRESAHQIEKNTFSQSIEIRVNEKGKIKVR